MAVADRLKPCFYYVVRYAPNVLRSEGLSIGVLVYCPEDTYLGCLFTDDFRRIRRIDPNADYRLIRELQHAFEEQIEEHEGDLEAYLRTLSESLSNAIRLEPPRACLLGDPQAEIEAVYARAVGHPLIRPSPQDTRLKIKQRLTAALMHAGIWERLEKRIPAARWTKPGDPFTFDYGYRPNGAIHFVHVLSLRRDIQLAKTLVYTLNCVRRMDAATLTAVVEGAPEVDDTSALAAQSILEDGGIGMRPVSELKTLTDSIRRELSP